MKSTSLQYERDNTSFETNISHNKENILPSSTPQNDELDNKIEDEIRPTPSLDGQAKPWRQNMKKMSESLVDGKINLVFSKVLA